MKKLTLIAIGRIIFGLLGIAAIATQLGSSIQLQRSIVNFFSFFTVESNILAVIILLVVGIGSLTNKKSNPQFVLLRGAVTLYMTMTGIIYASLLSGNEVALQTTIPWVNFTLHYLLPVIILLDWLLLPPKFPVPFKKALLWLVFPAVYLAYSLVRGAFTGWYPYPFINPITSGWGSVIISSVIIAIGVVFLAWLLGLRAPKKAAR